jgi:RNA binding exosome subunit
VSKTFQALHARTLCHATEDIDKVKQAFTSAIGDTDINISKTEGHHGNLIVVIEATLEDDDAIDGFFERFSDSDLDTIVKTLPSRVDGGQRRRDIRAPKGPFISCKVRIGGKGRAELRGPPL